MIPIRNSKNKIIAVIIFAFLIVIGFVTWYLNQPKQTPDQTRELTTEELTENLQSNAGATASSSPDFARRMAINELPYIGNSNYRKDEDHVYYGTDEIPDSDPNTFEILDEKFARDKDQVYSGGKIIEGADPSTFVRLGTSGYVKDSKSVYAEVGCGGSGYSIVFCFRKVEGADPQTFKFNSFNMPMDKDHVFYSDKIIPEADPETFSEHNGGKYGYSYWYDKNYIFVMANNRVGVIKEKCNNLDRIGGNYLKCDNKVYYEDKLLAGADVNTFVPVGVTANYAKDSKTVYFDGEVVAGADAATFNIGDGINARDVYHTYRYGKMVE